MDGPKKILTIDGGGLRGVFAAATIEQMEKAAGRKAREIFDCFYGTSTSAILAATRAIRVFFTDGIRILLLALPLLFSLGYSDAHSDTSVAYREFRTLLSQIKEAVRDQNKALALELLAKASRKLDEIEERPVLDVEALRWDMAQLNLDRAETMQNKTQIASFANESIDRWQEYIQWYSLLDEKQLSIIKERPTSNRIQAAVRQLGNAFMRRDNIKPYTIRDLFTAYVDLPAEYLSSHSVRLWRNWLFRCPTWKPTDGNSLRALEPKFSSGKKSCKEDWEDFASYLDEWIGKQELTPGKKRIFERWVKDLDYALGREGSS